MIKKSINKVLLSFPSTRRLFTALFLQVSRAPIIPQSLVLDLEEGIKFKFNSVDLVLNL